MAAHPERPQLQPHSQSAQPPAAGQPMFTPLADATPHRVADTALQALAAVIAECHGAGGRIDPMSGPWIHRRPGRWSQLPFHSRMFCALWPSDA